MRVTYLNVSLAPFLRLFFHAVFYALFLLLLVFDWPGEKLCVCMEGLFIVASLLVIS